MTERHSVWVDYSYAQILMVDKSGTSNCRSGKHLLPSSYFDRKVTVKMRPTDPKFMHLYPKLLGVDWDCHITGSKVLLGRSVERVGKEKKERLEDIVELGTDQMISRRHAVIQLNAIKNRWELKAYGMNGVEVNRKHVTNKSPPVELTPGALIKIVQQEFLFIPPSSSAADRRQQEVEQSSRTLESPHDAPAARTARVLEEMVIGILRSSDESGLSTADIATKVLQCPLQDNEEDVNHEYSKESVLETLVNSRKCELVEDSIELEATESDRAKWVVSPQYDNCNGLPWRSPVSSVGISIEAVYSMWQDREGLTQRQNDSDDMICLWRDARSIELIEKNDEFPSSSISTLNS